MITLKSPREIEKMREAGQLLSKVFEVIKPHIKEGVSTYAISKVAEDFIRANGGIPTFKGYGGFSGAICTSINDMVIHGIPSKKVILKNGDLLKVDAGVTLHGYVADAARTYFVGEVSDEAKKLAEVTKLSFFEGIKLIKPGVHLGDIGARIQEVIESNGYSVVKEYTGHGVGQQLHEDPYVPNYGIKGTGLILKEGMTLAIEPMVCQKNAKLYVIKDGWGAKTVDKGLTAHYENTIAITKDGVEILTISKEELDG